MKRKLEILGSLLHQPRVLFLDEPTNSLDPSSRRSLWDYLQQMRKENGTTVFFTTHYIEEAEQADRACIIHMRYAVDLTRSIYYQGQPAIYNKVVLVSPLTNFLLMAGMFVIFLIVGTMLFVRSERNK